MTNTSKTWIVTTTGDRPLEQVAADLKKRGFHVKDVLREVGCITGTAGDDVAKQARQIDGVSDVSPDIPIDVGPPNSSDTW